MLERSFIYYAFNIENSHYPVTFSQDIQQLKRQMAPLRAELDFYYKRIEKKLPYEVCDIIPTLKALEWMEAAKPFLVELLVYLIDPKTLDDTFNIVLHLLEDLSEKLYKTILPYSRSFGDDLFSIAYYRREVLLASNHRLEKLNILSRRFFLWIVLILLTLVMKSKTLFKKILTKLKQSSPVSCFL